MEWNLIYKGTVSIMKMIVFRENGRQEGYMDNGNLNQYEKETAGIITGAATMAIGEVDKETRIPVGRVCCFYLLQRW